MELKVGLQFKAFFSENNINNTPFNEVKGIIDGNVIVVLYQTHKGDYGYEIIPINQFDLYSKKEIYTPL